MIIYCRYILKAPPVYIAENDLQLNIIGGNPLQEAAVYTIVILHTIDNHQASLPNFGSFFSFFWK